MPIYVYKCTNCGHDIEAIQKFSDEPITKCDECGEEAMEKQITSGSFRLKGSGWYDNTAT